MWIICLILSYLLTYFSVYFIFLPVLLKLGWQNCIYLKHTMWWFDICAYCDKLILILTFKRNISNVSPFRLIFGQMTLNWTKFLLILSKSVFKKIWTGLKFTKSFSVSIKKTICFFLLISKCGVLHFLMLNFLPILGKKLIWSQCIIF